MNKIKHAEYFVILLGCTTDPSHVEQTIVILRYADMEKECIETHFVGFIAVDDTIVATFTDTILRELQYLGASTNNCRGQSCNGTNIGCSEFRYENTNISPQRWNPLRDVARSSTMAVLFFFNTKNIYPNVCKCLYSTENNTTTYVTTASVDSNFQS